MSTSITTIFSVLIYIFTFIISKNQLIFWSQANYWTLISLDVQIIAIAKVFAVPSHNISLRVSHGTNCDPHSWPWTLVQTSLAYGWGSVSNLENLAPLSTIEYHQLPPDIFQLAFFGVYVYLVLTTPHVCCAQSVGQLANALPRCPWRSALCRHCSYRQGLGLIHSTEDSSCLLPTGLCLKTRESQNHPRFISNFRILQKEAGQVMVNPCI